MCMQSYDFWTRSADELSEKKHESNSPSDAGAPVLPFEKPGVHHRYPPSIYRVSRITAAIYHNVVSIYLIIASTAPRRWR